MKNKKIKSWFRYQHFNTSPVKENHIDYIDCLSTLESFSGINTEPEENSDRWPLILQAINNLSDSDSISLLNKISKLKSEKIK